MVLVDLDVAAFVDFVGAFFVDFRAREVGVFVAGALVREMTSAGLSAAPSAWSVVREGGELSLAVFAESGTRKTGTTSFGRPISATRLCTC